ncbi:MAG: DNA recombination-dependent growth factor RdgC [uncultured Paraburkholderia sp.]|nr:MAG: DNA recombination-dependent growth factor RdgC [uncultured Paraburkholderia sp.]CAH2932512.1 MAG: DNA recombination-dependent growth factor RdgC [uncultured Paraburkholderia sp.]
MWFKNLQLHRLPAPWSVTPEQMQKWLASHALAPGHSVEMQSHGWAAPRDNAPDSLVYSLNGQMLLVFRAKNKLLPRAFSIRRDTRVCINCRNGWLVIDAASQAVANEVRGLLVKSIDQLPLGTVRVAQSPVAAMTDWLLSGEGPAGFSLDQDIELRSPAEGNATVRYVGHTLDADDMRRHIKAGKQCMRPAMTWNDRISFVLTPSLTIKRIVPLDVLKEAGDSTA